MSIHTYVMKIHSFSFLVCNLALLFAGTQAIPATADAFYHEQIPSIGPSMWAFGSDGVTIYARDGTTVLKTLPAVELGCPHQDDGGCDYYTVASDGHKYVWATAMHAFPHRADVFSLKIGVYVGGVGVCNTPLDLDYVPSREEMWVRCAEPYDDGTEDTGHMSVIPTNSLSSSTKQVRMNGLERQYGFAVFHSSLGNYGYATANNRDVLFKVDLAQREVVSNLTLPEGTNSTYDITYSPVNKHIFVRGRVCCSCGSDETDAPSCGRAPPFPVTVVTGPSAGQTLNGTCGMGCEGSPADTIGVLDFDTVTDQTVAQHNILEGTGFGATPEASPDGKYIVFFPNDGGKNIRILKPAGNGYPSTVAFDLPVNFQNVPPGMEAANDFAFVEWKDHNILAITSAQDSHIVLADLDKMPPTVHRLQLSSSSEPTGGSTIEWARGSNYLWVGSNSADQVYIVRLSDDGDITKAEVERTVSSAASHLVYVENYAEKKDFKEMSNFVLNLLTERDQSSTSTLHLTESASASTSSYETTAVASLRKELQAEMAANKEGADPVAVAGVILGCISLLMNTIILLFFYNLQRQEEETEKSRARSEQAVDTLTVKG